MVSKAVERSKAMTPTTFPLAFATAQSAWAHAKAFATAQSAWAHAKAIATDLPGWYNMHNSM